MSHFDIGWLVIFTFIAIKGAVALAWNRIEDHTIKTLRECQGPGYEVNRILAVTHLHSAAMVMGDPWAGLVSSWAVPLVKEDARALHARAGS